MLTSLFLSPVGGAPALAFCPLQGWAGVSKPSFWTPPIPPWAFNLVKALINPT